MVDPLLAFAWGGIGNFQTNSVAAVRDSLYFLLRSSVSVPQRSTPSLLVCFLSLLRIPKFPLFRRFPPSSLFQPLQTTPLPLFSSFPTAFSYLLSLFFPDSDLRLFSKPPGRPANHPLHQNIPFQTLSRPEQTAFRAPQTQSIISKYRQTGLVRRQLKCHLASLPLVPSSLRPWDTSSVLLL